MVKRIRWAGPTEAVDREDLDGPGSLVFICDPAVSERVEGVVGALRD